jgi:hypothetical protein
MAVLGFNIAVIGGETAVRHIQNLKVGITNAHSLREALALCLKKQHGISSTVYELRPEGDNRGVNMVLTPNGVSANQYIGIYEGLQLQGFNYEELQMAYTHSQKLVTILHDSEKHYTSILHDG